MMVEKETVSCDKAQFPTLWKPLNTNGKLMYVLLSRVVHFVLCMNMMCLSIVNQIHGNNRYENVVTQRHVTACPPPAGGGILADVRGVHL